MSRLIKIVGLLVVALVLCGAITGIVLFVLSGGNPVNYVQTGLVRLRLAGRAADINTSIGSDTTPLRFTIAPGNTPRQIGANLVDAGLITDSDLFVDYVRVNGLDTQLEAGTYFLTRAESLGEIANALTDSASSQFAFRILEGWRMEEVAAVIDDNPYFGFSGAEFISVVGPGAVIDANFAAYVGLPTGASLEGFLYPDTYQLPAQVTPDILKNTLLQAFIDRVGTALAGEAATQDLTLYEAVTLASIIQREAVHPDEHPMISSAYRNRLSIGMKLDADPTVQYSIGFENDRWWPQITQADYTEVISSYNTYLNTGLPPGPIANPGISAIEAAIRPTESPYVYFRARCDGSGYHNFATTFEEHVANGC